MTKAIKNVSDDAWRDFKALAGLNNMTMGRFFEEMVKEQKSKPKNNDWLEDLRKNPLITDKKDFLRRTKQFRKEFTLDRECTS